MFSANILAVSFGGNILVVSFGFCSQFYHRFWSSVYLLANSQYPLRADHAQFISLSTLYSSYSQLSEAGAIIPLYKRRDWGARCLRKFLQSIQLADYGARQAHSPASILNEFVITFSFATWKFQWKDNSVMFQSLSDNEDMPFKSFKKMVSVLTLPLSPRPFLLPWNLPESAHL